MMNEHILTQSVNGLKLDVIIQTMYPDTEIVFQCKV